MATLHDTTFLGESEILISSLVLFEIRSVDLVFFAVGAGNALLLLPFLPFDNPLQALLGVKNLTRVIMCARSTRSPGAQIAVGK